MLFQVPLTVRGYECSVDRTVPLPVVLSYFEHCRWNWIQEASLGLLDGLHSGHFFVVHRQTVCLARDFGIGTRARARAVLRDVGRVQGHVEHDLVRDDGVLLARADVTAIWIGPTGRMARLPRNTVGALTKESLDSTTAPDIEGLEDSFLTPPERSHPVVLERRVTRAVPANTERTNLTVRPSDCDMFGHVNASNYLRFFEDQFGRARRADIEYRGQAVAGDTVQIRSWPVAEEQRAFALLRDDQVLCRAVLEA
ncbi:MAG: acyl-CoA thioesterase FadM [Myxococcota bacterium]|jgi:acyl-CoA thioesterase FadM